jgi:hypothetical protein
MKRVLAMLVLVAGCDSPTVEVLLPRTTPPGSHDDDGDGDGSVDADADDDDELPTDDFPADDLEDPVVYTDCESVLAFAQGGERCEDLPEEGCFEEDECSVRAFYCELGQLYPYSEEKCGCVDDLECEPGFLCAGNHCHECAWDQTCDPCPEGQDYLMRNGCPTCQCAPPGQCHDDTECGEGFVCSLGTACAEGCSRLDCCVNACSDGSCPEPAPEGCSMECEDRPECGNLCLAEACWCDGQTGTWQCKAGACDVGIAACFYSAESL